MKQTLIILLCLLFSNSQAQETDLEQAFDFWEGEWNVSWQGGAGVNTISRTLDGKVLQENFEITEGQNVGFKGTSISVFNPRKKSWHQAWADSNGGYYNFIGKVLTNKKIFKTLPVESDGKTYIQRMVFYNIKKDGFTWDWELSQDGGETWQLQWKINYARK